MKGKTLIKILLAVLFIAALGFLIGAIYRYTDGFNEDFKTMYLERNGEKILSSVSTAHFDCGEEVSYSVKYTFPGGKDETRDFSVDVAPNAEADFEFQVDGITRLWRAQDLTKIFDVKKEASGFSFAVPSPCRISDVVKTLYPNAGELTLPEDLDLEQAFYTLTVTSYNKAVTYTVNFSACEKEHYTVDLNVKGIGGRYIPADAYIARIEYIPYAAFMRAAKFTVTIRDTNVEPARLEWYGEGGTSGTVYFTSESASTYTCILPLETSCHATIYLNYKTEPGHSIKTQIIGGEDYNVDLHCQQGAIKGEQVTFTLRALGAFVLSSVKIVYSETEQLLSPVGNVYSHEYQFTMPDCDVTLVIELQNLNEPADPQHSIKTQIIGGEDYNVDLHIQETANYGDTVSFRLQATGAFVLSSVKIVYSETQEQLSPVGNVYSHEYQFTMPDCDVTLVIELQNLNELS